MARSPRSSTVEVATDTSIERLIAKGISKAAVHCPPWICGLMVVAAAALFHHLWGGKHAGAATAWAVLGLCVSTFVLTGMTWLISHQRRPIGRIHSTATVLLACVYVMIATITGLLQPVVVFLELVFGGTLALTWNLRIVIRGQDGESGVRDPLAHLWERAREVSGFDGTTAKVITVEEHKIDAQVKIDGGDRTVEDLQKKTLNMETAMGLPPGSLTITADQNRADLAEMSISDPRILQTTLPYPGPQHAGGSAADPYRLGLYQDMTPVDLVFLNFHLMINGMSGSGKSFGGGWNLLASIMSRPDASIIAADLTKADQSLGDAAAAIDWLVFTKAQANALMDGLQRAVPARTAWLSAHGYKKWEKGCGLQAVYVLLEECPDVLRVVDEDDFVQLAKAARSAGVYLILSLQRSDYSQVPTIVRGQFGAMACFGVASSDDAAFGLPEKVRDAGASPEDWGVDHPGMCYLSAPGIPMAKRIMPIRTYFIEPKQMQELATRFAASARPLDDVTARAFGDAYAKRAQSQQAVQLIRKQAAGEPQDDAPAPVRPDRTRPICHAAELVISSQYASASMLARKMRIEQGYADRLLDLLEDRGVVGPAGAGETREVLNAPEELEATVTALADADVEDGNTFDEAVTTPDPSPDMHVDVDDDDAVAPPAADEDFGWERAPEPARRMPPAEARAAFIEQLRAWKKAGKAQIEGPDLKPLRDRTGMTSRGWGKKMLDLAARDGILRRDPVRPVYYFTDAPIDVDDHELVGAP
ncbi:DNA translocase FtsK [Actinomadura sp. DC4]|uniref:DNA translocase FtsK n=1 Tax=Actinomadura sp. DC4 TaxID=3055069 RepID=UPI0025B275E4|nr:DNA translocase FtsK [Actinomadura sp. DC4]MDN3356107.1 DNA translocase FtsK [Actinomadura sp. DC4]